MDTYMSAIVGVSALGLLIDVLLPKSDVYDYVKKVFGIIMVVVIATPILNIIGGEIRLEDIIYSNGYDIDACYVSTVNNLRAETAENYIENAILEEGYIATVNCDVSSGNYQIEIIFEIDVLNEKDKHINIIEKVYKLSYYLCGVEEDEVKISCLKTI